MPEEYASQAGAFSMQLIQRYLEDVHAAANPGSPSEVGGDTYLFFHNKYDEWATQRAQGALTKRALGNLAVQAIRDYLANDALCGEDVCAASLSARSAFEHFDARIEIIDRLEQGVPLETILHELQEADQLDAGINQTPDGPL